MANDPLEGFHEVNLASPTSPDLLGVYESGAQEQTTSPGVIYRPHPSALCSAPIQANALDVSDLPTQPVYSSPRKIFLLRQSFFGKGTKLMGLLRVGKVLFFYKGKMFISDILNNPMF